jgi:tRNA A37 methylthiotransferase MiaB
MLKEMGYAFTQNPKEADMVLYNTCAIGKTLSFGYSEKWGNWFFINAKTPP